MSGSPWDHLMSLDQLIAAAQYVFSCTGGGSRFNPKERACVEGKLGNAWSAELYVEDDNKVEGFTFAAHLMFSLIKGHCLVDGNKRIAWIALVDTLRELGWEIDADDDDVVAFCLGLCERTDSSSDDVRDWLAAPGRLIPVPG